MRSVCLRSGKKRQRLSPASSLVRLDHLNCYAARSRLMMPTSTVYAGGPTTQTSWHPVVMKGPSSCGLLMSYLFDATAMAPALVHGSLKHRSAQLRSPKVLVVCSLLSIVLGDGLQYGRKTSQLSIWTHAVLAHCSSQAVVHAASCSRSPESGAGCLQVWRVH